METEVTQPTVAGFNEEIALYGNGISIKAIFT